MVIPELQQACHFGAQAQESQLSEENRVRLA